MCSMLPSQVVPLKKVLIIGASFLKCNTIYHLIDWSKHGLKAYMESAGGMGLLKMTRIDPDILILMDTLAWTATVRLINKFNIKCSKAEIIIITENPSNFCDELYDGVQLLPADNITEKKLLEALNNSGISNQVQDIPNSFQQLIGDRRQLRKILDSFISDRVLLCRIEICPSAIKNPARFQRMEKLLEAEVSQKWFQEISGSYILCFEILDIGMIEQIKTINGLLLAIRQKARRILDGNIVFYISDTVAKDNALEAYAGLSQMRIYRFFITRDAVISPNLIRQECPGTPVDWESVNEKYSSLLESIMCAKKDPAAAIIRSIFYDDILKSGSLSTFNQIFSQLENILNCMAIIFNIPTTENNLFDNDFDNIEEALEAQLSLLEIIMQGRKDAIQDYSPVVTETLLNICKHHNDQIYVGALAEQVNVSASYLGRIFKQQIGMGVSKCINLIRIYMAAGELVRSDQRITDIAEAHGFYDSKYFCKTFHQIMGDSPSEWRKKHKGTT